MTSRCCAAPVLCMHQLLHGQRVLLQSWLIRTLACSFGAQHGQGSVMRGLGVEQVHPVIEQAQALWCSMPLGLLQENRA